MVKVLARSIREFKKPAILTPLLVSVEVVMECAIPFVIAQLVNQMQAGCSLDVIAKYVPYFAGFWRCGRKDLRGGVHRLCAQPAQRHVL